MNRRVLILALASMLLAWLSGQINHYLAPLQVYMWCGGLYIALAGLLLEYRTGALTVFLAGLLLDSGAPVPFGLHAFLFLAAHAFVFKVRARAPREETVVGVAVALLANLGLFIALSFLRIDPVTETARTWMRTFADLIVSQVLLALIAPWFFALQKRLLELTGLDSRNLSRHTF